MNLPNAYEMKMKSLLKNEFDDYAACLNEKSFTGLRVNTLKTTPKNLYERLDFELTSVPWCDTGFYYDSSAARPSKHPYYFAGLYYIQEPSAMSSAAVLGINEGDRVLDICAAPGGKSTQAAAKLNGSGLIVSNDISASRCRALVKNIENAGVKNAVITSESPENLAEKFPSFFNKIIVDAPCSGEGMFRKDSQTVKSWDTHKSEVCCAIQRQILNCAAQMLSANGRIVYSTCTFEPEENEGTIDTFIKEHSEFEILDIQNGIFEQAHPEWIENGSEALKKCARLWPHKLKGEGHFVAVLQKKDGEYCKPQTITSIGHKEIPDFYSFAQENLTHSIDGAFELHKNALYMIPYALKLDGLRVARSGLYLGELKSKRFEPSQAFAMTLKSSDVKRSLDFSSESSDVLRYLRGESFQAQADNGFNLVTVDGFPLGWGKMQKGRLKNGLLPAWRMQS